LKIFTPFCWIFPLNLMIIIKKNQKKGQLNIAGYVLLYLVFVLKRFYFTNF